MRYFMLFGGFIGFLLTFSIGLYSGNALDTALVDGGIGCVVGAVLMRFFRQIIARCARAVLMEKAMEKARARAAADQAPAEPTNS